MFTYSGICVTYVSSVTGPSTNQCGPFYSRPAFHVHDQFTLARHSTSYPARLLTALNPSLDPGLEPQTPRNSVDVR